MKTNQHKKYIRYDKQIPTIAQINIMSSYLSRSDSHFKVMSWYINESIAGEEGYDRNIVNRYTELQLDLFRADIIITDGDNLIGLYYFLPNGRKLFAPIVMGISYKNENIGILNELKKIGKNIVKNAPLAGFLIENVKEYEEIPCELYNVVAELYASWIKNICNDGKA